MEAKRMAIVYDFDGTLARGNLQEQSFIPDIGMSRDAFWEEARQRTRRDDADAILVYMHLMVEKAAAKGIPISIDELRRHGAQAPLFPGLTGGGWFDRINRFGADHGLSVEHYIVSSGIEEMIDGCPIRGFFRHVFASKFIYRDGEARWPGVAINFTTKTQCLFRINKGIINNWDNEAVNAVMTEASRPLPFDRMIFIGDGDTDIPTMRMLKQKGGHSIAVYDPDRSGRDLQKIHGLISDDRVDFVAPADYGDASQLDITVKGIIGRIARRNRPAPAAGRETAVPPMPDGSVGIAHMPHAQAAVDVGLMEL